MTEIKVGIVGSRRRNTPSDLRKVWDAYDTIIERNDTDFITIISGGASMGADKFAEAIARDQGGKLITYLPYGHHTLDYYSRNRRIAEDSDILIACVAPDRKGGTENTIHWFKTLHPDGELILVE